MAANQGLWAQLDATLQQDIPATTQLIDLLQCEREALEKRNYDDFRQLVSSKQPLLDMLQGNAATRQKLLSDAGFGDEAGTLAAADQQSPAVAKHWRKLRELWSQCQELNEINDRISRRTRLVVGHMLDLLRGQQGEARLYTDKGNTSSNGGGRTITSA